MSVHEPATSQHPSSLQAAEPAPRRVLAVCSAGGHLKQLARLVPRVPNVGKITWLTHDSGLTVDVLRAAGRKGDELFYAPYAAPRDLRNLARDARVARRVLRRESYDLAISTGAGIAVAALPQARATGVRSCFIESATRSDGPSMTGRILQRVPGIELYSQNDGFPRGWARLGSVHDGFERGDDRPAAGVRRIVVTLGTIRPYGFDRLVRRLLSILPRTAEVLWQTGVTEVEGLGIDGRASVPTGELETAIAGADVVIAHAGTGSALTAFEMGRCPLLVPRRAAFGEHVDDHQVETARELSARGLAVYVEAEDLGIEHLEAAARRTVVVRSDPPPLPL